MFRILWSKDKQDIEILGDILKQVPLKFFMSLDIFPHFEILQTRPLVQQ